jgi:hypothetical protein
VLEKVFNDSPSVFVPAAMAVYFSDSIIVVNEMIDMATAAK